MHPALRFHLSLIYPFNIDQVKFFNDSLLAKTRVLRKMGLN